MSKLIPLLFAGTGAAAVSVGGAYLIKNGGSGSDVQVRENNVATVGNSPEKQVPTLEFADINAFKNASVANVECVKDFAGLENLTGVDASAKTISGSANKIDGTFIGISGETNVSKGCLIVNWNRKEYTNGKGNGNFKLLGTFEKNGKGFISFVVAKEKEVKKLGLTGIFYALTKTDGRGSITHKKELTDAKVVSATDSTPEEKFPKVGSGLTDLSNNSGWKMFASKEELENVCVESESDCKTPDKEKTLRGYGIGKGSSSSQSKLDGWTGNLNKWGNNLYVNSEIDIPAIATKEQGDWARVNIIESIPT